MEKTTTSERLQYLIRTVPIKQTEILEKCNLYSEKLGTKITKSSLSQYVSGKVTPSGDKVYLLSKALGVNPSWLMGYDSAQYLSKASKELMEQSSTELSINENNIEYLYNKLDTTGKIVIRKILSLELERANAINMLKNKLSELRNDNVISMTYYNKLAAAGNGEYLFDDVPTSTIDVPKGLAKDADFVIGVNGDSMEPTFSNGDKVLVKKQDTVKLGEIGIFIDGNDCYIKEKGKDCLVSHNKEYGVILGTDTMRCVGKVLGKV